MEDTELTLLHPNHVKATRLVAILMSLPLLAGAIIAEFATPLVPGLIIVPALLILAFIIFRLPWRRYQARGYTLAEERLRVVSGILFRSDTLVPFGRVQHIDVNQGPIQRMYDLATLTVHTAGSHNASVNLPGLAHGDATEMREAIRAAIKRDTA
ncbi:PH domain-containing protein [Erythrobacter sp. W53]|uniref:PH domain-containing protein n=1 Tax=Erythrobacter sp. W53 TaxID=3425947 RepID=UPI003D767C74